MRDIIVVIRPAEPRSGPQIQSADSKRKQLAANRRDGQAEKISTTSGGPPRARPAAESDPARPLLSLLLDGAPGRLSFHFTSWRSAGGRRRKKRSRYEQHARSSQRCCCCGRDGCGFLALLFSQPLASERPAERGGGRRRSRASPTPRDEHFGLLASST